MYSRLGFFPLKKYLDLFGVFIIIFSLKIYNTHLNCIVMTHRGLMYSPSLLNVLDSNSTMAWPMVALKFHFERGHNHNTIYFKFLRSSIVH